MTSHFVRIAAMERIPRVRALALSARSILSACCAFLCVDSLAHVCLSVRSCARFRALASSRARAMSHFRSVAVSIMTAQSLVFSLLHAPVYSSNYFKRAWPITRALHCACSSCRRSHSARSHCARSCCARWVLRAQIEVLSYRCLRSLTVVVARLECGRW